MTEPLSNLLRDRFGGDIHVPAELEDNPVLCGMAAQTRPFVRPDVSDFELV